MAECYDHLGNKFKTKAEMCKYYGINQTTFNTRLKSGMTLKDALSKEVIKENTECYEHL